MHGTATSFGAAFERVGITKPEMEFHTAVARFFNAGGTVERAHWVVDQAAQKLRGGHSVIGAQAKSAAPQPNGGLGHAAYVAPGGRAQPAYSEPSPVQIAAAISARVRSAKSVFDAELTRTGQMWGNVHYCELDAMVEDADIAAALRRHIGSKSGKERLKKIRELISPRAFTQLINKVRGGKHA